jgi:hypothetical protein
VVLKDAAATRVKEAKSVPRIAPMRAARRT